MKREARRMNGMGGRVSTASGVLLEHSTEKQGSGFRGQGSAEEIRAGRIGVQVSQATDP